MVKMLRSLGIDTWTEKGWNDNSKYNPVLGIDILNA